MWTLFNKHMRKFRRQPNKKVKRKSNILNVESRLKELIVSCIFPGHCSTASKGACVLIVDNMTTVMELLRYILYAVSQL